ncbi:hypothetical protein SARC_09735 [Sphaeroforma arctica JP610]|uniref:Uncharacterized protein n=1 Tax=Sphaeroforma arctica JP610 TaxID=667725 RepID=A0A0L0FM29_9EUKA|nr:hypothetical protein SARC_09735 [Sphaeroforma arctica JP610]KNC77815.1 hypothetical protein SARC_09735 [Sphaeroforma arctica JP610]|eukprot:XP_014151717.1 hypothetical protein SARC_09735 [Sphaeroforma arctica JP610]
MTTAAPGASGTMHSAILMVLSDRFKQCFEILDDDNKEVWVDCKEVLEHSGYNADVADRVKAVVGKALRKAFGDALRWKKFRRQDGSRRNRYGLKAIDPWPAVEAPVILYGLMSVCAKKNNNGIRTTLSQSDIHSNSQLQTEKMFQRRASLAAVNDLYSFGQQHRKQYNEVPPETMHSQKYSQNGQMAHQYSNGIRRAYNGDSDDDGSSMPVNHSIASQILQVNPCQLGSKESKPNQMHFNQMNYSQMSVSANQMNNYQLNNNHILTTGLQNGNDYDTNTDWNQQSYDNQGVGGTVTLSTTQTHNLRTQSLGKSARQSPGSVKDISSVRQNPYNLNELHDTLRGHTGGTQFSPQMQSLSEYGQSNNMHNETFQRNSSAPQEYENIWNTFSQRDQFSRQDTNGFTGPNGYQNVNNNNHGIYDQQSMKRSGSEGQLYPGHQQRSMLRHQPYPGNKSFNGSMGNYPTSAANADEYNEHIMNNDSAVMNTRLQSLF